MVTLLCILGVLLLLVAMHPFTSYPWSLLVLEAVRPLPRTAMPDNPDELSCAICMCAYNEAAVIEAKIQNLLALREREPSLEILLYVDAASDGTAAIVQRYAHLFFVHIAEQRHGKTHGMNLLVRQARAPIVIFTDANVMLDMNCVADFKRHFRDPEVGCVCGNLIYTNEATSATAATGSVYWRFEEAVKRLEMTTGSMMGADGSLFAIRRALHRAPPDHIIDDMYVSLMILCQGYRVIQASDAHAYEASVTAAGEEFRRKVRIACQAFNVHRLVWPQLRRLDRITLYKYVSHKLIRWFTIYLLALAALAFELALLISGHALLAVMLPLSMALLFMAANALWRQRIAPLTSLLSAFVSTGVGVWRSLRGERYQTWTPAASIRATSIRRVG